MLRSIRWRLAASYAILILLSVTLMGTFALWFLQRYVEGKEREYLKANAQAVALQAKGFLAPQVRRIALGELASTSAFLGDARVRILSTAGDLIADSGDQGMSDEFLWVIPSGLAEIDTERSGTSPFILSMPTMRREEAPKSSRDIMPLLRDLPLGTSHIYARRMPTPWGRRFLFEGEEPQTRGNGAPAEPARFVGARFAHESYRLLHLYSLNEHGIFVLDYPVPEGLRELRYRIVVDGLWMAYPSNPASLRDAQGDEFSLFTLQREPPRLISNPKPESKERFTFTFRGAPGKRISIAGDFNNWDPFMDYMAETEPGLYRITLRIGPGNHFYCFVSEGRRILDQYNPETGVNQDGDIVSYFSMPS